MHAKRRPPKLEPITISTFTGEPKEWKTFIQLYMSIIHKNKSLSKIEKFQYLLSYLGPEPKRISKLLNTGVQQI
uniref:Uncharacterized protein n=1 Tax=Phlebotomus papatasi TaxID=29031 RepID=A0A1B0DLV3_PHLPP